MIDVEEPVLRETHKYLVTYIHESTIYPEVLNIKYECRVNHLHKESTPRDILVAIQKIKFWLDNVMANGIITAIDDVFGINLLYSSNNPGLVTPSVPGNMSLVQIIHSKLNAIASPHCVVSYVTLSSAEETTEYVYDENIQSQYSLPDKTYLEDIYHDIPWWERNDFSSMDYTNEEVKQNEDLLESLSSNDALKEFESQLRAALQETEGAFTEEELECEIEIELEDLDDDDIDDENDTDDDPGWKPRVV